MLWNTGLKKKVAKTKQNKTAGKPGVGGSATKDRKILGAWVVQ